MTEQPSSHSRSPEHQALIARDVSAISRISVVPSMLQIITEMTGMRFAAVARVDETSWTACAVRESLDFGLEVGGELELATTLCDEIRSSHQTIIVDQASADDQYRDHHTPRIYGFESYISVPIFRTDGSFFGTICALDPLPAQLKQSNIPATMASFARMLALQLDAEQSARDTEVALSEAREMAELREQFVAVLGHDLRNPLYAIIASAELLQRKASDANGLRAAERILASGKRASQLVDDILDFARGRLGDGIPLKSETSENLEAALHQVVAEIQDVHPERDIQARISPLGMIRCDRQRVAQLLSNLIANAMAHGRSDGPVKISAEVHDSVFVLSVNNQGEPIPEQTLASLFKPYWRPISNEPQAGLGLGLYIASEIARSHGGKMAVRSNADEGTTFSFILPTAPKS